MLSIVIADDEIGIIELCKMLIEYPNAKIIGEAHNGLELFDVIGNLHPNTVITDINMPGMTGLDLIKKARVTYPDVNFIIMSGYTDFAYVQSALRFGVWDYLLKPLQKQELNRILEKLDQHLESVRVQTEQQEMIESDLQESMSMLQAKYLQDIWGGGASLSIPEMNGRPILDFFGKKLQCLLFLVENQFATQMTDVRSTLRQADSSLEAIGTLATEGGLETVSFSAGTMVINLWLYPDNTAETIWETLRRDIEREIRRFNSQSSFVCLTAATSHLLLGGEDQISVLMEQARAALKCRLEQPGQPLLSYQLKSRMDLEQLPHFQEASLLQEAILHLDGDKACSVISKIGLEYDFSVPGSQYRLTEEILQCLNKSFRLLPSVDEMESGPPEISVEDVMTGRASGQVLWNNIQASTRSALLDYQSYFAKRENSIIVKAKQYAAQHLVENISLNDVAKYVCLSSAYFSTLFKSETGISFIKYLQRLRIDRAKKLLKESNMRIQDIAEEVGYRDLKFFNKIFLSETTVTPSEYRKFYG